MKKNLILASLLALLLVVTWLLTEKNIFSETPLAENQIQKALESAKRIKLPNAELNEIAGVWRLEDSELARADYLLELHKSLEQLKVSRVISGKDASEFFTSPLKIEIDKQEITFGDISATGESFYLQVSGSRDVFVIDLQEMASLAMADDDNLLQREKYNRLRDLISLPSFRWREKRLAALTQFVSFKSWKAGEYELNVAKVTSKPWGMTIMQALQAGISSLEVAGNIIKEKPKKHASMEDWSFTLEDESVAVWEFYQHPDLELIYVWIPRLSKGYPLDQGSSDFIRGFVPKLINKPFTLSIYPELLTTAQLQEGSDVWSVNLGREGWNSDRPINEKNAQAILEFFSSKQHFDSLSLLGSKDCEKIQSGARFKLKVNNDLWGILPVKGALIFLECTTHVALSWSLPLESSMDFATLRVK